jgi:hypothetical protein
MHDMIDEYYLWFIGILYQHFLGKENVKVVVMQYPIIGNKDFSESSSDVSKF